MQNKSEDHDKDLARKRHLHEAEAGAAGAVVGATIGAIGGPPGAIAGAVIGGLASAALTGLAEKEGHTKAKHDEELDAAIGVYGGDIGAPNLEHPPESRRR